VKTQLAALGKGQAYTPSLWVTRGREKNKSNQQDGRMGGKKVPSMADKMEKAYGLPTKPWVHDEGTPKQGFWESQRMNEPALRGIPEKKNLGLAEPLARYPGGKVEKKKK